MLDELKGMLLCSNSVLPEHDGFPTKNGHQIFIFIFIFGFLWMMTISRWSLSNHDFFEFGGDQLEMVTSSQKQEVTNI